MRILVVEDESGTAGFLCRALAEAGYTPCHAPDAVKGLDLASSEHWDLVIMDRMLPGQADGLAIVQRLRDAGSRVPVLILSALATPDEKVRGLRGGGDDYLAKPFSLAELLARCEALLRRAASQGEQGVLRSADLTLDLRSRKVERSGRAIDLQPREFRLLEYLLRNQGQVVTRSMLLEAVWDFHFEPRTNVIDVQISRLRSKIDRDFDTPLLHTVRGAGYRLSAHA